MSETAVTPVVSARKPWIKTLLIVLSILLLLFVYGAGIAAFPYFIRVSFWNKNCNLALTLHKVYAGIYPQFLEDGTVSGPVQECEAYVLAVTSEKEERWEAAYAAYQDYLSAYSTGMFVEEAHEHSAIALWNIVKAQAAQEKYKEAAANLNLILSDYGNTSPSAEAGELLPSVYTSWGVNLREAGDFEKSEQVLNEFKSWSLAHKKDESVKAAQCELVETYVAWSLDLQSEKQFEPALAKLDLAKAADPKAQFDSAKRVKQARSQVYVAWGNDLLEQEKFASAIDKFKLAISKSDKAEAGSAQDALAKGQIEWARSLSASDDFKDALVHVDDARDSAASESMQAAAESALQETYLAFSKSTGPQARQAIKDALETLCEKGRAPKLPIFGLNKDSVRVGIYGVEETLSGNMIARTPGEIHYVACIKADNRTVQTRDHRDILLKFSGGYWYRVVKQYRVQVIWNVSLIKMDTLRTAGEETFSGPEPPPFSEQGGNYIYGTAPAKELEAWLESKIR